MSEAILSALSDNPQATVAELPGAQEWANKFFGTEIGLATDKPFATEVITKICWDDANAPITNVTYWDPYSEGYDSGPGDLSDDWHTDDTTHNGLFRGWVVENAYDKLSAVFGVLADPFYDEEEIFDKLRELLDEEWVAPLGQNARDERATKAIMAEWQRLSPVARTVLLAELAKS